MQYFQPQWKLKDVINEIDRETGAAVFKKGAKNNY